MAYDTKVIIKMMSRIMLKAQTLEEAYFDLKEAASVEGVSLPEYKDAKEALKAMRGNGSEQ